MVANAFFCLVGDNIRSMATRIANVDPVLLALRDAPLAYNSKRQYICLLLRLQNMTNKSITQLVTDADETIVAIEGAYADVNTRKAVVVAVKAAVKYSPELRSRVLDRMGPWTTFFKEMKRISVERSMSGEKNAKQRKVWVEWTADVVKAREEQEPYSKRHLLLCLYSMVPPLRHDFGNVRIFPTEDDVPDGYAGNHLILSTREFVLQIYKTSRAMGVYRKKWPPELVRIVRETLKRCPRTYLFEKTLAGGTGTIPYRDSKDFKEFSNALLRKIFGKNVTINILRHSFISGIDFNAKRPFELAEIASDMRHSIAQQLEYRRNF